jgi:WD40 repeat protein
LDKGGELAHVIATGWEKRTYFWRESPDEVKVEKVLPKSSL